MKKTVRFKQLSNITLGLQFNVQGMYIVIFLVLGMDKFALYVSLFICKVERRFFFSSLITRCNSQLLKMAQNHCNRNATGTNSKVTLDQRQVGITQNVKSRVCTNACSKFQTKIVKRSQDISIKNRVASKSQRIVILERDESKF